MEIRIPYEVAKEAVDKAGNPDEPGTAIGFFIWTLDNQYEVLIERPKEWTVTLSNVSSMPIDPS